MIKIINDLNKDQLDGLARLCFDLAKGTFAFALLPPISVELNPIQISIKITISIIAGIAFTYLALIILKTEGRERK